MSERGKSVASKPQREGNRRSRHLWQEPRATAPPTTTPPPAPPQRTPEEQALVDEWRRRRQAVPRVAVRETTAGQELQPSTNDRELWSARLAQTFGVRDLDLLTQLLSQVSRCVWKGEAAQTLNMTVAAIAGIASRDPLEALLAVQMVGVHNTAMELLRRTLIPDQTVDGVNMGVSRATKLLRMFTAQADTLMRYRGGGQQKVTVEHVHVNAGGQAVVGEVHHTGQGRGDDVAN